MPGPRDGVAWEYPPKWGEELQTEHEKYLAEKVYKKPLIVHDYPKGCKAFYMRCAARSASTAVTANHRQTPRVVDAASTRDARDAYGSARAPNCLPGGTHA